MDYLTGTWDLGSGLWHQGSGIRDPSICGQLLGTRKLEAVMWDLGSAIQVLGSGIWGQGSGIWDLRILYQELRIWDLGFGFLGSGSRDLTSGICGLGLGSEIWDLGSRIWDWDCGTIAADLGCTSDGFIFSFWGGMVEAQRGHK